MKTACVFAHFDADNVVDQYVIYYLKSLRPIVDELVFVTTSELLETVACELRDAGLTIIQRENVGHDFVSYKAGIATIQLEQYDELILCNDSVYGPIGDLGATLKTLRDSGSDFQGMTESFDYAHHLQSFFLVFSKKVFSSTAFSNFWASVEVLSNKQEIISRYEVGLTRQLEDAGFGFSSLTPYKDLGSLRRVRKAWRQYLKTLRQRCLELKFWQDVFKVMSGRMEIGTNPSHSEWRVLLEEYRVPFIKVGLLRDNPRRLSGLASVYGVIHAVDPGYPTELISAHLARKAVVLDD